MQVSSKVHNQLLKIADERAQGRRQYSLTGEAPSFNTYMYIAAFSIGIV